MALRTLLEVTESMGFTCKMISQSSAWNGLLEPNNCICGEISMIGTRHRIPSRNWTSANGLLPSLPEKMVPVQLLICPKSRSLSRLMMEGLKTDWIPGRHTLSSLRKKYQQFMIMSFGILLKENTNFKERSLPVLPTLRFTRLMLASLLLSIKLPPTHTLRT